VKIFQHVRVIPHYGCPLDIVTISHPTIGITRTGEGKCSSILRCNRGEIASLGLGNYVCALTNSSTSRYGTTTRHRATAVSYSTHYDAYQRHTNQPCVINATMSYRIHYLYEILLDLFTLDNITLLSILLMTQSHDFAKNP
jgi:hypothetical protein